MLCVEIQRHENGNDNGNDNDNENVNDNYNGNDNINVNEEEPGGRKKIKSFLHLRKFLKA